MEYLIKLPVMRIVLASALIFSTVLLLQAPATGQELEISANEAYAKGDYATAQSKWRSAADKGDLKAQVNLGRLYALGHGVDKDEVVAMSWFRKAADNGSAVAHHNLGVMYETGAHRDIEAAAKHYRVAAEGGRTESQTALGKLYQDGRGVARDYREAAKWLEKAADDDDPEAQFLLGAFYANGWGVERDNGEMLYWTRRSARQGHSKALFHIGLAYDQGRGIERNPASAARFYAVAAKKGNTGAKARLGEMYFFGIGVEQSYEVAFTFLTKAASAGEAPAEYLLGYAYHAGKGVEKNVERGIAYYQRAADRGHVHAWIKLASAYDLGDGVPENPNQAFELYRRGANAGNSSAQYAIGLAYQSGRGVGADADADEAVRWFLKAARGGHGDAQLTLARMYRDGTGVGRNERAALRWIDEAVRGGNPGALVELAERHLAGSGVAHDPDRAIDLLRQAAEKGSIPAGIRLADLLSEGGQVDRDLVRAASWYGRLTEKGDAYSTSMLAALHLRGDGGLARDPERAAELFRIAAKLGSAHAARMLAALYLEGEGVEKSQTKAAHWYTLAAAKGDYAANYALGNLYQHGLGVGRDPVAAVRNFASALAIKEKSVGRDSLEITDVLRRLAELEHDIGRNERAATYYRRAAAILRGATGNEDAYFETLIGLVAVYRDQRLLDEADSVMSLALKSLGPGSEGMALINKMKLGALYELLGRNARAAEVYNDLVATITKSEGPEPGNWRGYNNALSARGRVLDNLGRDDEADADFIRALTQMERHKSAGFEFHHARALTDYGKFLVRIGQIGEAVATFEKAEKLIDRIGMTDHPAGLSGAGEFAKAYERQGNIEAAISVLRRATRSHARRGRRLARPNAAGAREQHQQTHRLLMEYARLLTKPPVSPGRAAEAFEAAQGIKSVGLTFTLRRIVARLAREDDALGRLIDARRRSIAAGRRLERRLVGPEGGSGQLAAAEFRDGFKQLRTQERELYGLESTLGKQFPKIGSLMSLAPVPVVEAQRLLGAGEAIVATLAGRRETHVWVLTRKASHYHRAPLGASELAGMVDLLRASLDPRRRSQNEGIKPYPLELSARLYRQLFASAHGVLEGVSHVFYAPEGALRNLPLSVLVVDLARARPSADGGLVVSGRESTDEPVAELTSGTATASKSRFARYREVVWFIDKFSYSRIPSINALDALRLNPTASRAPRRFIGIGVPELADRSKFHGLLPDPGSAARLRVMARSLGAGDAVLHLGRKARESAVKGLALNQFRTIAFATPGVMAGSNSSVAEPALVLTPPETGSRAGDGLLTTSEIAALNLDADLVVLGAAGASAPDGEAGADWLSGLAQAFVHAGARSIMVAHWPVEREAAAALTTGMFTRSGGGPRSLARLLQHSALDLLNDDTRPDRFAHPTYWGAFSIVGDGARKY